MTTCFRLPTWCPWKWRKEDAHTIGSHELVQASSSTPRLHFDPVRRAVLRGMAEHNLEHKFLASALLTFGAGKFSVVGTILCIAGHLAVSLASTHLVLVVCCWQLKFLQTLPNVSCRQNFLHVRTSGLEEGRAGSVWKPCNSFDGLASFWGQRKERPGIYSKFDKCLTNNALCTANIIHISECGFLPLFWLMCDRWSPSILFTTQGGILNGSWNILNYWFPRTGFALLETMYRSILSSPGV